MYDKGGYGEIEWYLIKYKKKQQKKCCFLVAEKGIFWYTLEGGGGVSFPLDVKGVVGFFWPK